MAVHMKDLWKLPSFREAKVLTGEEYLSNVIRQVSIADTPPTSVDYVVSQRGDFYISSLYFAKDGEDTLYRFLETLIDTGASGLCIIDEYFSDLPEKVKAFCKRQHLPVLMVDQNIPYAEMIKEIMGLLLSDQKKLQEEGRLLSLMGDSCNREQRSSILYDINPHFLSHVTAIFVDTKEKRDQTAIYQFFNHNMEMSGVPYRNGVMGIVSYKDVSAASKKIDYCLERVRSFNDNIPVGISAADHPLIDCGLAMEEALFASQMAGAEEIKEPTVYFDHMGPLKLISLLYGRPELDVFCHQGTDVLLDYDRSHNSCLYETMRIFTGNGRDYRATAQEMFLHQNTIRYRVRKAGELMNQVCPSPDFCETFSLAHKIRVLRGDV